jgi:hypothetical protein
MELPIIPMSMKEVVCGMMAGLEEIKQECDRWKAMVPTDFDEFC